MIPIVSDTHFGSKSFNKGIFELMMLFFEKQFFPFLLKNKVKDVLHLGDVFHNRNIIDLYILQQVKQRFFQFFEDNNINLHIVVGNHDIYYKTTIEYNALVENTKEFKNIIIYDKPTKETIGRYTVNLVPWVINYEKDLDLSVNADICCGHFDIQGFKMTKTQLSEEGADSEMFKKYPLVFSGHYHVHGSKDNIHYVGTPYQINWADYDEDKGFYVLKEDFKYEFIQNETNARFLKLYYDEIDDRVSVRVGGLIRGRVVELKNINEAIELASNNYVRLITNNVMNKTMLDAFWTSLTRVSRDDYKIEILDANEVIESFDVSELEEQIQCESDVFSTVRTFLDGMEFEKDIDKSVLLGLFESLYKEASEITDDGEI